MKKFLAKLWSYSLILPVTDDNNFGTNEMGNGDKERTSYRISLFGFFWGHKAKYLLTYNFKNKRFSFYHEITLPKNLIHDHTIQTINVIDIIKHTIDAIIVAKMSNIISISSFIIYSSF